MTTTQSLVATETVGSRVAAAACVGVHGKGYESQENAGEEKLPHLSPVRSHRAYSHSLDVVVEIRGQVSCESCERNGTWLSSLAVLGSSLLGQQDNPDSSSAKASNQTWPRVDGWLAGSDEERRDGKENARHDTQPGDRPHTATEGERRCRPEARCGRCKQIA